FETVKFSEWLSSAVKSAQGSSGPVVTGVELAAKAPPGIAERFHTALRDVASAWSDVVLPGSVRGRAEIQISTPAINLVRSEVIVHVYVRANYLPDHGTTPLPEPIHGEIRISYQLVPKTVQGKNKLEVVVPADNSRIQFFPAPGSGLSPAAAEDIAVHVRKAVRERFTVAPVALPDNFKYFEYKGLGGSGNLYDAHYADA